MENIKLNFHEVQRLVDFIENFGESTLIEEPSILHTQLSTEIITQLVSELPPHKYNKVLDIGCGSGVALELFTKNGYDPIGITINAKEVEICKNKGYKAIQMDQSFMSFDDKTFDFIWARHVIEHSIMPYFTLLEYRRVLKDDGVLYLEVPAPDTIFNHERNPYHFSTLTKSAWQSLIPRAGFEIVVTKDISLGFENFKEQDEYWVFISHKNLKAK